MTIIAKVIADSVSPQNIRLMTLQLRYPKCIHGEFMTHRVFSRNASSSRAIPVKRLIQDVIDDPYIPLHWGKNQPGMQADEECNAVIEKFLSDTETNVGHKWEREELWLLARDNAVAVADAFSNAGYHKQIINRLLEPWMHINVVVTATEWTNFFALRDHTDAQPEIRALAQTMKIAMEDSTPKLLQPGEWHLPYTTSTDMSFYDAPELKAIKLSVARCARVSYLTQEGKTPTIQEDLALYQRLVGSEPLHASPAEHQATPDEPFGNHSRRPHKHEPSTSWLKPELHGNFKGWIQYRKTLPGECK